eukprot:COSAG05_NODE_1573_length_4515_cov_33.607790_4_plen_246_part_00
MLRRVQVGEHRTAQAGRPAWWNLRRRRRACRVRRLQPHRPPTPSCARGASAPGVAPPPPVQPVLPPPPLAAAAAAAAPTAPTVRLNTLSLAHMRACWHTGKSAVDLNRKYDYEIACICARVDIGGNTVHSTKGSDRNTSSACLAAASDTCLALACFCSSALRFCSRSRLRAAIHTNANQLSAADPVPIRTKYLIEEQEFAKYRRIGKISVKGLDERKVSLEINISTCIYTKQAGLCPHAGGREGL